MDHRSLRARARSDFQMQMLRSIRFRFGRIGLTIGLAGGIALFFFHRAPLPSAPRESKTGTLPVSSAVGIRANPPEIVSAADESIPALNGSETDEELLALARTVVARSPERAIAWARAQGDSVPGRRLLSAVLRAWGESDPAAAVDWALAQDDGERRQDMEAALAGAVRQPQLALAIVRRLLADDPDDGAGCGPALVVALNNAGQFQTVLDFLTDGPLDSRLDWTTATFRHWGESRPQDAVKALDAIADAQLRNSAFQAVMNGWAAGDPAGLAAYAVSLSQGENRTFALSQAMDNWSLQDPAGLGAWLNTLATGAEYDAGVALMIGKSDGANRSPEVALGWVEGISDPGLKRASLLRVLEQWVQADSTAPAEYVKNAAWLDDQQRPALLEKMGTAR
jgi:hypothetical protein